VSWIDVLGYVAYPSVVTVGIGHWIIVFVMVATACGRSKSAGTDGGPRIDGGGPADVALSVETLGNVAFIEETVNGVNDTVTAGGFETIAEADTTSTEGPCQITNRTTGTSTLQSAGTITISYGSNQSFMMSPSEYENIASSFLFAAGDAITMSATGALVPAFTSEITFPSALTVTSPTTFSTISKSGFSATWAATTSEVHISVVQFPDNSHALAIDCSFAGSSGSGAVPAAALADLLTNGAGSTDAEISTETRASAQAGAYAVTVQANAVALAMDGVSVQP
jgi:hypothetical protein